MKIVKKIIMLNLFLMILFSLSISVKASEIDDLKLYYEDLRKSIQEDYDAGSLTQEDYEQMINACNEEEKNRIELLEEQQIIEEEANIIDQSSQKPNIVTNYDEAGDKIEDYSNIDIESLDNKQTIYFEVKIAEGTSVSDEFYIKATVSAMNSIYETSVILDEANDFKGEIIVPNDTYIADYYYPAGTANEVSIDESFIDASINPIKTIYVVGGRSIITDKQEIIKIEGSQVVQEDKNNIDISLIIKISIGVIVFIGLIIFIVIAVKKRNENKI